MPESVILNTIRARAGNFDTSANALIELRNAGATDTELTALAAAEGTAIQPVGVPAPNQAVLGGTIFRSAAGDPVLLFRAACLDRNPDNPPPMGCPVAFAVTRFEGEIGLRTEVKADAWHGLATPVAYGTFIFLKDRLIFDMATREMSDSQKPMDQSKNRIHNFSLPYNQVSLSYVKRFKPNEFVKLAPADQVRYSFTASLSPQYLTPVIQEFLLRLIKDFPGTLDVVLNAIYGSGTALDQISTSVYVSHNLTDQQADLDKRIERDRAMAAALREGDAGQASGVNWLGLIASLADLKNAVGSNGAASPSIQSQQAIWNAAQAIAGQPSTSSGSTVQTNSIEAAKNEQLAKIQSMSRTTTSVPATRSNTAKNPLTAASGTSQASGTDASGSMRSPSNRENSQDTTAQHQSAPTSSLASTSTSAKTPVTTPATNPSFSTQDSQGNVTLGTGSPRACATSSSGSQLPLTPGTIAGTCNPASCRGLGYSVHVVSKWTDEKKMEVIGFFYNNSGAPATCTYAFHKQGVWTEQSQIYLKTNDQHKGGESGGVWSTGIDSSDIKYVCFEGIDPVDVHGDLCNQGVKFTGMTAAGSDK